MTTFNDRQKGFENKFAHDEEMQFKAAARRNRLVGLWAASLLGKTGADADAYAMEIVRADFAEHGHEDVYRKLAADLDYRADEEHDPREDGRDARRRQGPDHERAAEEVAARRTPERCARLRSVMSH